MLDSTQLELHHSSWSCLLVRQTDCHAGRTGPDADSWYFDPLARRKISRVATESRVRATCVVPEGMYDGCDSSQDEKQWVPGDASYD